MAATCKNVKKNSPSGRKIKVPLSWRIPSLLAMVPIGIAIFYGIFHGFGGKIPFSEADRDTIFIAFICAVGIPTFAYSIIDKIMKGIILRRSSTDIAADIAKDIAVTAAVAAVDVLTGSTAGGESGSGSSSSGGAKGGGGEFGGGGASGSY